MTVAQRPDIPCKTSAVIPSDSDAVNSLIRQVRSCTDPALDNLSERCSSENITCEILNSLGSDDEEIKVAPKLNDKLAQLVQHRWKGRCNLQVSGLVGCRLVGCRSVGCRSACSVFDHCDCDCGSLNSDRCNFVRNITVKL